MSVRVSEENKFQVGDLVEILDLTNVRGVSPWFERDKYVGKVGKVIRQERVSNYGYHRWETVVAVIQDDSTIRNVTIRTAYRFTDCPLKPVFKL